MAEIIEYQGAFPQDDGHGPQVGRRMPMSPMRPDGRKEGHKEIEPGAAVRDRQHRATAGYRLYKIGFIFFSRNDHRMVLSRTNSPRIITCAIWSDPKA